MHYKVIEFQVILIKIFKGYILRWSKKVETNNTTID